jgi:hypothetical protein
VKLAASNSVEEARSLVSEAPPRDSLGRGYYTRLDFFLGDFTVPHGSSYQEKELYLQFIRRLDAKGRLPPGKGKQVQEPLRRAMTN